MTTGKKWMIGALVVPLVLMIVLSALISTSPVQAEPMAAPTPLSVTRASTSAQLATLYNGNVAANGRLGCVNASNHTLADVHYSIDQTVVNTMTLKLQFTNDTPGTTGATYVDGLNIVASNAADATDLQQFQTFGAWTCVSAVVSNTNPVDVSVVVLLK